MDNDREKLNEARMALALKLSKDEVYYDVILWNVKRYNESNIDSDKKKLMKSINVLMRVIFGRHWSCYKCGINQHGVWVK